MTRAGTPPATSCSAAWWKRCAAASARWTGSIAGGGDEFLLLFPAALPEEVVPRVRDAIRAVAQLEVSVGAAAFSGTDDLPAAIERADRAMYEEKTRNRSGREHGGAPPAEVRSARDEAVGELT